MSFITLLLYIFCTFIRPQDWVPGIMGLRLVNMLALATLGFLIFERLGKRKFALVKVPQNKLLLGFFISILMSHISHTYFAGLTAAMTDFFVIFILYFLVLNAVNSEGKFKMLIWFVCALIIVLVFQGIYQVKTGYGWAGQSLTYQNDVVRINWIGIFNDPNDLALTFIVAVGFMCAFAFGQTNFFQKLIAFPALGLLLYGILLANSRGGFLALMATIFFYFVKRTGKIFIGGVLGGMGAVAVLALGPSRMGLLTTTEASANARVNLWYEGIQLIKRSPIFGVGYDMFMDALPQTAHNSYILAAAELGMVGLFFWVALFYSSFKGLSIIQNKDKKLKTYALGLQSSLVGFCAAAFFLSRTYIIIPYLLVAFSGSLMHIASLKNDTLDFSFTRKDAQISALLSVGVLALALTAVKIGL